MAAQFLILCSIGLYAKPHSFSLKPKTPIQIRKNKFWLRNFPSSPNRIHLNTDSLKRKVKVENILKFPASRNLGTLKIQKNFFWNMNIFAMTFIFPLYCLVARAERLKVELRLLQLLWCVCLSNEDYTLNRNCWKFFF